VLILKILVEEFPFSDEDLDRFIHRESGFLARRSEDE